MKIDLSHYGHNQKELLELGRRPIVAPLYDLMKEHFPTHFDGNENVVSSNSNRFYGPSFNYFRQMEHGFIVGRAHIPTNGPRDVIGLDLTYMAGTFQNPAPIQIGRVARSDLKSVIGNMGAKSARGFLNTLAAQNKKPKSLNSPFSWVTLDTGDTYMWGFAVKPKNGRIEHLKNHFDPNVGRFMDWVNKNADELTDLITLWELQMRMDDDVNSVTSEEIKKLLQADSTRYLTELDKKLEKILQTKPDTKVKDYCVDPVH